MANGKKQSVKDDTLNKIKRCFGERIAFGQGMVLRLCRNGDVVQHSEQPCLITAMQGSDYVLDNQCAGARQYSGGDVFAVYRTRESGLVVEKIPNEATCNFFRNLPDEIKAVDQGMRHCW